MSVICCALRSITSKARSLRSSAIVPTGSIRAKVRAEIDTRPSCRRMIVRMVISVTLNLGAAVVETPLVTLSSSVIHVLHLADQLRRSPIDGADDCLGFGSAEQLDRQ